MNQKQGNCVLFNMNIKGGSQISCIGKCKHEHKGSITDFLYLQKICDPSFMFMFTLTNTGNLWSILYVHVYTYQYRKSMIHPLCSCLHLPIRFPVLVSVNMNIKGGSQISCIGKCKHEHKGWIIDFMFTLTNTGNLWSILYVHVYTYQYRKPMIHPLCSCLHLPIQEICAPSFMFMFTLTNTGNMCSILYVHVYTYQYKGWSIDFLYW
jgi:hypothetical protein